MRCNAPTQYNTTWRQDGFKVLTTVWPSLSPFSMATDRDEYIGRGGDEWIVLTLLYSLPIRMLNKEDDVVEFSTTSVRLRFRLFCGRFNWWETIVKLLIFDYRSECYVTLFSSHTQSVYSFASYAYVPTVTRWAVSDKSQENIARLRLSLKSIMLSGKGRVNVVLFV